MIKDLGVLVLAECKQCHNTFERSILKGNREHPNQIYCSLYCQRRAYYLHKMHDPKWRLKKLMSFAKNRAKIKDVPFDLDIKYLLSLWNGKCSISGVDLQLDAGSGRVYRRAPSIDRIIPELGYVKGNVRIVTYQVNVAISEFGEEGLYKLVKEVAT